MKLPVVKTLVETFDLAQLEQAEATLYDELTPEINVPGDDEGEQLTHVIAAIWIRKDMEANGTDIKAAMRNYTQKVRNSIN